MSTIFLFLGGIGVWEIILILLTAIPFGLWLWALIDCIQGNFDKNNKLVWIIIILFVPFVGSILYLTIGRNQKTNKIIASK